MARIEDLQAENKTLRAQLVAERFNQSRFVAERLKIPADMACARFGGSFALEGDRVVAMDADRNRIMSRERPWAEADFDEALETLVEQYPNRAAIMRGHGDNGAAGASTITREVFFKLAPLEQHHAILAQKLKLVD